jgi:hypothetical protein
MNKTKAMIIIVIGCAIMLGMYLSTGGKKKAVAQKDYDILCIEGVSYVAINQGLNSAMMSIMLNQNSHIIPCEK